MSRSADRRPDGPSPGATSLLERARVRAALDVVDISALTRQRLATTDAVLEVALHVRMDDGSLRTFTGWRVRHDTGRGPAKGGVRYHPDVGPDQLRLLAAEMTIKTALLDLPFGGAKGGVAVDPHQLSERELERLTRAYADAIADQAGAERDIPAPDVGTGPQFAGWFADAHRRRTGRHTPGVVTGKPLALGGSHGRAGATAAGAFRVVETLVGKPGQAGERVAVQGFGSVGAAMAARLAGAGWRVVAVSDSKVALHDPAGLDVAAARAAKDAGDLAAGPGEVVDRDALLTIDCDVLVPAALEGAVDGSVARALRTGCIVEVANAPVTPEAEPVLADRGIRILPDVLANAGGVVVSHAEWVQNREGRRWSEQQVADRLGEQMTTAARRVHELAEQRGIALPTAAYALALQRIDEAVRAAGTGG